MAPLGARNSSFPGYLRLSASSRCLFVLLSAASLGRVPPTRRAPVLSSCAASLRGGASPTPPSTVCSLPRFRSGRGLTRCFLWRLPCVSCAVPCCICGGGDAPPSPALCGCSSSSGCAALRLRSAMTLSTVMATALAPFTSSSPAYTSAAPIAAWWAACAVTFVAACGGALRLLNRNQWCQVRPRSTTPGVKKSGKTSLCCKLLPTSARHIGFSISHRGPKTHNPRTQVLYVVPHPTQTTVVPDTHALVGVLPSTTSRRSITPKRAARHMHGLTSSTAPSVGEVEVLVWPRRPTPECRTS